MLYFLFSECVVQSCVYAKGKGTRIVYKNALYVYVIMIDNTLEYI